MVVEFGFLCFALGAFCGPLYLGNLVLTFAAYLRYTKQMGKERIGQVRAKKEFEKKQEFFQNESITNYETVKAFNNEKLENKRY
jgi:ABC-type transport system involved in Fe-S cluster assembly fused permease/ATPase subunit